MYCPRHIGFAWGPAGPVPLKTLGYIEFGVASASGGKGTVDLDSLTFEPLADEAAPPEPKWSTDGKSMTADLGIPREVEVCRTQVLLDAIQSNLNVLLSDDGASWQPSTAIRGNVNSAIFIPTPESEARYIKIEGPDLGAVTSSGGPKQLATTSARARPRSFANSQRDHEAGRDPHPRGHLPRYCYNEQAYWTVVGVADDTQKSVSSTKTA